MTDIQEFLGTRQAQRLTDENPQKGEQRGNIFNGVLSTRNRHIFQELWFEKHFDPALSYSLSLTFSGIACDERNFQSDRQSRVSAMSEA